MKVLRIILVLVLVLAVAGGCKTSGGGGAGTASVKLVNNMRGDTIFHFYVSNSASETWGPDQLDSDQVLAPGHTLTITGIRPGTWDLMCSRLDGTPLATRKQVTLRAGYITTWTISDK